MLTSFLSSLTSVDLLISLQEARTIAGTLERKCDDVEGRLIMGRVYSRLTDAMIAEIKRQYALEAA
jgi:hypothetical protein